MTANPEPLTLLIPYLHACTVRMQCSLFLNRSSSFKCPKILVALAFTCEACEIRVFESISL